MPVTAVGSDRIFPLKPLSGDFDLLRQADAGLEKQLSKLHFTRLAIVIIFAFMFASALHRRNEEAIQTTLRDIDATFSSDKSQIPKLDPISTYLFRRDWYSENGNFGDLVDKLKAQYSEVFTVKVSALGTDLSFDLRLIIVTLPFWLPIAHIYISTVREKKRIIRIMVVELIQRADTAEVKPGDLLIFGQGRNPYQTYPGKLIDIAFWIITTILLVFIMWITDIHAVDGAPFLFRIMAVAALVTAFYGAAYASLVATHLREQANALLAPNSMKLPVDAFGRCWKWANESIATVHKKVKPRLPIMLSSLLILGTLLLETAQTSCNRPGLAGAPRKGYELVQGKADWAPSLDPLFYSQNDVHNSVGRLTYCLSLLLAFIGICVVFAGKYLRLPLLFSMLGYACLVIWLMFVAGCASPLFILWKSWTPFAPLGIALIVAAIGLIIRRNSIDRWYGVLRALRMVGVSFLICDGVYLASNLLTLPGLMVLFVSVPVLAIGFYSAAWNARLLVTHGRGGR